MKTIKDLELENKKVLIRCDFNVPIKEGKILDDTRIVNSLQTINYALDQNAKVILFSHLGRIKKEEDLEKNSLEIVGKKLSQLLNKNVLFINETRGEKLENAISNMKNKDIILVQNTRYEDLNGKKESSNNEELAKYWASLGDVFINDAFGTIHRAHASNVGLAEKLPSAIGFLIEKELKALSILNNPEKPFTVILGGAKVEDKIGVIKNLSEKADYILIGGGMAFTFLKAEGYNTGKSIMRIIDELKNHNPGIDVIIAANVIQNEAVELFKDYLVFATRLSKNSFVGVNQSKQTGKTGPDTADRLFNLIKKRY